MTDDKKFFVRAFVIIGLIGLMGAAIFITHPIYNVWSQTKEGEAELARATSNRQIKIAEAKATEESAKSLADAEVIRAEGTAKANKIIGDSLRDNESYLRYMWIRGLEDGKNEVIYIPTEAGLPILEAGKRVNKVERDK